MDQVNLYYIIGAGLVLMCLARIGKSEAITSGGTHWCGIVPRRCIVGRIIGGLYATTFVFASISLLCLGCGLLIYSLFSLITHLS